MELDGDPLRAAVVPNGEQRRIFGEYEDEDNANVEYAELYARSLTQGTKRPLSS